MASACFEENRLPYFILGWIQNAFLWLFLGCVKSISLSDSTDRWGQPRNIWAHVKFFKNYSHILVAKVQCFILMQDFCFQAGTVEASSIPDLWRSSAGGEQVGGNIPVVFCWWLRYAEVICRFFGSKGDFLAQLHTAGRKIVWGSSFVLFLLFYNLGNTQGINQLLFQLRTTEVSHPPCSRWGQCKSNGSEDKTRTKGSSVQKQGRKPSESRFGHRVCSLQCERALKCSEMPCLKWAVPGYVQHQNNLAIKLNFSLISQISLHLTRCFKGTMHLLSRKMRKTPQMLCKKWNQT